MAEGGEAVTSDVEQGVESSGRGITLYREGGLKVFVPRKPRIPLNEGLHIEVSSGHDKKESPKQILERYLMALGSAKAIAESGTTPEGWANTRLEEGQVVSIYGRVPGEKNSWRKPVDTYNRGVGEISVLEPDYNTQRLRELFIRYLPKWKHLAEKINLFGDGVNGRDIDSGEGEEIPVWENDKFTLVVVSKPHLEGIHLVVHPKKSSRRQWQTIRGSDQEQPYIQATLEATAIAMGAQRLLAEGRGEIHNSGNWASGLKLKEEGGKFDLKNFQARRKAEKKLHRPDIAVPEEQIDTSMHVHIYIPESGPVVLPPMSEKEAIQRMNEARQKGEPIEEYKRIIEQWENIPNVTLQQIGDVREKIGKGKLANWLLQNTAGPLGK
ncbi:hypothetical protein HYS29_02085 [Candidatus Microgenomates bacterium]|nr:hypothetical protein [Candidatus Microgenomates bacterium]